MKRFTHILLLTGLLACGDDEKVGNTPPVAEFVFADDIDRIILDGSLSTDPNSDPLSFQWTATDGSIVFHDRVFVGYETNGDSFFKIPVGASAMSVDVTLTVSDGKSQTVRIKTVDVPEFSVIRSFGLGTSLTKEGSNDVAYEWYLDQANSGPHSAVNCGPAVVTMAIKWFDQSFNGSIEEARNVYHSSGGWWYTNDIIAYLNKYNVIHRTINLDQISNLTGEIDAGNIVILCLDMFQVDYFKDLEYHVDKFYETNAAGWGHFIVVKGYKEIDGKLFYETYDPYSFNNSYSAGGLKGKDRYYRSSNLDLATNNWWDYAIVVERPGSSGGRKGGVDVNQIVHKPGR